MPSQKISKSTPQLASYGATVEIHFCDGFGSPVDGDKSVSGGSQADTGHTPPLEVLVENVIPEIEILGEDFDPAVPSVHDVEVVVSVQYE